MKIFLPNVLEITSGASEDPPIPQRINSVRSRNFAAIASSIGSKCREVSSKSTQFKRTAASAAADGPQVVASLTAIRTFVFASNSYLASSRSTLVRDGPLTWIISVRLLRFWQRSHLRQIQIQQRVLVLMLTRHSVQVR